MNDIQIAHLIAKVLDIHCPYHAPHKVNHKNKKQIMVVYKMDSRTLRMVLTRDIQTLKPILNLDPGIAYTYLSKFRDTSLLYDTIKYYIEHGSYRP